MMTLAKEESTDIYFFTKDETKQTRKKQFSFLIHKIDKLYEKSDKTIV